MNNIEKLLEQYFEGQTSAEEEARLRRFFASGDVPENFAMYKPLFAYFDGEIAAGGRESNEMPTQAEPANKNRRATATGRKVALWLSSAAACAAILIGVFAALTPQSQKCPGEGDYVIIDGRCYTDAKTIRSATLNTLREISGNNDDFTEEKSSEATRIIESQLKEFDSFFNE